MTIFLEYHFMKIYISFTRYYFENKKYLICQNVHHNQKSLNINNGKLKLHINNNGHLSFKKISFAAFQIQYQKILEILLNRKQEVVSMLGSYSSF